MHAKSRQSRSTLCGPVDCSLLGSSFHWILQARILKWVAMLSSKGIFLTLEGNLSDPGIEPTSPVAPTLQGDSLPLSHQGSPIKHRQTAKIN